MDAASTSTAAAGTRTGRQGEALPTRSIGADLDGAARPRRQGPRRVPHRLGARQRGAGLDGPEPGQPVGGSGRGSRRERGAGRSPPRRGRPARRPGPAAPGAPAPAPRPAASDRGPPRPRARSRAGGGRRPPGSARRPAGARRGPRRRAARAPRPAAGTRTAPAKSGAFASSARTAPGGPRTSTDTSGRAVNGAPPSMSIAGDLVVREPRAHLDAAEGGPRGARGVGHDQDDPVDARRREGMAHHVPVPDPAVAEAPPERQGVALGIGRPGRVEARQLAGRTGAASRNVGTGGSSAAADATGPAATAAPTAVNRHASARYLTGPPPGRITGRGSRRRHALTGRKPPMAGDASVSSGVVRCRRTLVLFARRSCSCRPRTLRRTRPCRRRS